MSIENQIQELIKVDFDFEHVSQTANRNHYIVTLSTVNGKEEFPFFQGLGITEDPSLESVVYSLLMDSFAGDLPNAREFQLEYGYESLDRAEEIYEKCKEITRQLDRLGLLEFTDELDEIFQDY